MTIHFLDIIMYFVTCIIIWYFTLPKEFRYEIGAIIGLIVMIVYTIIYIILFAIIDYNWIDIFHGIDFNIKTSL